VVVVVVVVVAVVVVVLLVHVCFMCFIESSPLPLRGCLSEACYTTRPRATKS
jgi:hypothetical protein